jgi:hypothetical protein
MVEVVESVTEAKLNPVGENLHYDGEKLAVFGNFDDPGMTYTREKIEGAVAALEAGDESVSFRDGRKIKKTGGSSLGLSIHYNDDGYRGARMTRFYDKEDGTEGIISLFEAVDGE